MLLQSMGAMLASVKRIAPMGRSYRKRCSYIA